MTNLVQVNQAVQVRTFGYDSLGRLHQANNPESGIINYNYDNSGSLISKTDARNVTTTFAYDNLNRVLTRTYSDGTPQVTYTYDDPAIQFAKGRLTKVSSAISETRYNSFDNLGKLFASQQITDGQTYNFGYQYNLSGALVEETYPSGRKVKNVLDNNGDLSQVQSQKNATGIWRPYVSNFVYDAAGKLVAEYSSEIASVNDAKVAYLTNDHLGSPRITTDQLGQVIARHDYHPFGDEIGTLNGGSPHRTTALNYTTDSVRQKFTGYERDNETDLDFAEARMFEGYLGRFTSPDPYKIVAEVQYQKNPATAKQMLIDYLSVPQRWNRYIYVQNRPLLYTDPTGEIEVLTGSAADQKKALQRLKEELGAERWKYVTVTNVCMEGVDGDPKTGVTVLSIAKSDVDAFSKIGDDQNNRDYSNGMAAILSSDKVVEFRIADTYSERGKNEPSSVASSGGGVTVPANVSPTGNIQIFVSKNAVRDANSAFQKLFESGEVVSNDKKTLRFNSVYEVDGHEHGHAADRVRNVFTDGSVNFENAMRSRGQNPQRRLAEQ